MTRGGPPGWGLGVELSLVVNLKPCIEDVSIARNYPLLGAVTRQGLLKTHKTLYISQCSYLYSAYFRENVLVACS
jgi:hypothetical protein